MFGDNSLLSMPTRDETYTDITKLIINVSDSEDYEYDKKEHSTLM